MKSKNRKRIIFAVLLASISSAQFAIAAEENTPTSATALPLPHFEDTTAKRRKFALATCFSKADTDNKEIAVAAATLPVAQAAIVIAKAIPNPVYNMQYGWGPAWQYIVAGNNQVVGLTEEILVAGRRTKRTNVAQANYLANALQIEAVRFAIHNRVRRAYAQLAADFAYASLIETQQKIAENLLDISQKRFDAGKAPGAEMLQSKLAVMQYKPQQNTALGKIEQDSATLAQLLGETPQQENIIETDENSLFKLSAERNTLVPAVERGIPALQQLLPSAWRERNDLKASIQQAWVNRKALTLAKTQRIPDPLIGFNYMFSSYKQFQTQYFNPTGSTANIAGNSVPQEPGFMFSYSQEMPIFYQYQGQIAHAKANWLLQLRQNDLTRAQIASQIVTAYESLLATRATIQKYQRDLLPAALKVAQLTRRGYELGKMDLATSILAQQNYQQLRSSYFDSVVAYQNAWADLEQAVGVPLAM
jgi:cobalt-zinc-cadmium efflux system outer membrane protein